MIAITSIIKNRIKMLPHFLHNLIRLDADEPVEYIFIDDCSTDGSREYLKHFAKNRPNVRLEFQNIDVFPKNTSSRIEDMLERKMLYVHLGYLRNKVVEYCNEAGANYQFSVDSDILVKPDLLMHLKHNKLDYCSTIIFNDAYINNKLDYTNLLKRHVNFGVMLFREGSERFGNFDYHLNHIYQGVFTGACYLVTDKVLKSGAEFGYHTLGEDIKYCLELIQMGIIPAVDTHVKAVHIMCDKFLSQALGVFGALK